ncbi:hypothetical protein NLD30_01565 [SCandidatus Aminicenantes bacterium Aminicenantia_JdfR_composite]|jgi:amino acid transporter|nr:hypothetical protein [SCandidatus Aminicenantes bacterium Aminicenantia_JdfR_composite]MCP2596280.1 hypothetical protein [Candidatus Aminicenantes bacterium AC-335-G13]MCP2597855.1 hypothetical protein [Candidatus Aminicenantes bacterium AC-335-L06]MCP2605606.1 hypothetical protein [Candidatus Aminicenantes bacterium AC-335-O07]MCP2620488.1 hypothetical protein [Candidatus Aminicenantes bacterium AC-334-E05]
MNSKKRKMGLLSVISIGIGVMIGAGIFSIIGIGCQIAGNAVYLGFIIAGIIALLSSYSYAKLGTKYPSMDWIYFCSFSLCQGFWGLCHDFFQ